MKLRLFAPLTKVDAVQRIVYGVATAEEVDKSGEIFDYDSSVPYFKQWSADINKVTDGKSFGNIRAMHGKVAAGKINEEIVFNDAAKCIEIAAKIVDDNEWKKVEEGVYTGFSIGGSYAKVWKDETLGKNRFTANPAEISIVDNPCVKTATFTMIKADGVEADVEFQHHGVPEVDEADRSETPSNDLVAKRATVLAKAVGAETAWPEFIEQASAELTKIDPAKLEAAGQAAAKAAAETPIVVAEPVVLTNEEVAIEATKMAKAAGNENNWPAYIAPARDALTKAKVDAKVKPKDSKKTADAKDDPKADDAKDDPKAKTADKAFVATPRNPAPGLEQVWKAQDGTTFTTRKEAEAHNDKLDKAAGAPDAAKALQEALGKADVALALKPGDKPAPVADVAKGVAVVDAATLAKAFADLESATLAPGLRNFLMAKAAEFKVDLPKRLTKGADEYFPELRKSLYDVGRLAELIQSLMYWVQSVEYEESYENDTASTTAATAKQLVAQLCQVLRTRVVEETQELFTGVEDPIIIELFEMSHRPRGVDAIEKLFRDAPDGLEKSAVVSSLGFLSKVGAKHSMKDQATLNKAHDATAELGADCSGGGDAEKLAKAGARHSKADLAKIQAAHDNLVDVGAECSDGDDEEAEKLAKTAPVTGNALSKDERVLLIKLAADNEALTKVATEAVEKIGVLTKRVEEIAAQPIPGGPAATDTFRVIGKGEDDAMTNDANAVLAEIQKSNPDALATALIKLSQKSGGTKFSPGS